MKREIFKVDWREYWEKRAGAIDSDLILVRDEISQKEFDYLAESIVNKLKLEAPDRVLDLGCGNGIITRIISHRVKMVAGVDFSFQMLQRAGKKQKKELYLAGNAVRLPLKENLFDKCLCFGMLHYLDSEKTTMLIDELRRVCKPGAIMVLGDIPDKDKRFKFLLKSLLKKGGISRLFRIGKNFLKGEKDTADWAWYQKKELLNIFSSRGLKAAIIPREKDLLENDFRYEVVIFNKKASGD